MPLDLQQFCMWYGALQSTLDARILDLLLHEPDVRTVALDACSAAGGVKGSEHVTELHSREDLDRFVSSQEEKVLTVVNLSISSADPCIHIFPAVLALARSFKGYAAFGRCG